MGRAIRPRHGGAGWRPTQRVGMGRRHFVRLVGLGKNARLLPVIAAVAALALNLAPSASGHEGPHGPGEGRLVGTGAFGAIELVGSLRLDEAVPGLISDVAALGNYAYLGRYAPGVCGGAEGSVREGGVYVIDISDPVQPRQVGFIPARRGAYVGEGVQVLRVDTDAFDGDLLVLNNESCARGSTAGVSLWDVTDPLQPTALDEDTRDVAATDARQTFPHHGNVHSAFAWDAGDRAYLVLVDNEQHGRKDVDILDITDPRRPVRVAEVGLPDWPSAQAPAAYGDETFAHDMVVKRIDGRWYMLLSYWDAGWVVLDVDDPANPVFVDDFDHPAPDPLTGAARPEGNAHQAEWTADNRFIIGADEDFSPSRMDFQVLSGPRPGAYTAREFGFSRPIAALPDRTLSGPTVFGGSGCDFDVAAIPPPSALGPLAPDDESILVLTRAAGLEPSHPHDVCRLDEKLQNAAHAGYEAVVVDVYYLSSGAAAARDAASCGIGSPRPIHAICVDHHAMHALFDPRPRPAVRSPYGGDGGHEPVPGELGARITASPRFDGWGYVHLIDARSLQPLGQYAIPEALDPAFASGFGDLSAHEVATDPTDPDLAYLAYYSGGLRAVQIRCAAGATSTCELVEVGGYLHPEGNNFWGVEVHRHPNGQEYILASDRDSGLRIFRHTGR